MKSLEPTDKPKMCIDILKEAQMNVRSYLTKPLQPELVLKEVLSWYKITEQQLFRLRYIKVKRLYMFLLQEACFLDYKKIAEMTRCYNELQVIQAIEKIKETMKKDSVLLANVGGIVERAKAFAEIEEKISENSVDEKEKAQ